MRPDAGVVKTVVRENGAAVANAAIRTWTIEQVEAAPFLLRQRVGIAVEEIVDRRLVGVQGALVGGDGHGNAHGIDGWIAKGFIEQRRVAAVCNPNI